MIRIGKTKGILYSSAHFMMTAQRMRQLDKEYSRNHLSSLTAKKHGGVNRNDGQLQSYKLARERLKKYYQKMFRYLLDVVCLNAFIIYKKKGGSISRFDFLLILAESLSSMGGLVEPAIRGCSSKSPKLSQLLGRCFPDMVPGTSKKNPTRRCVVS